MVFRLHKLDFSHSRPSGSGGKGFFKVVSVFYLNYVAIFIFWKIKRSFKVWPFIRTNLTSSYSPKDADELPSVFYVMHMYYVVKKGACPFIWTTSNPLHPRMLSAKKVGTWDRLICLLCLLITGGQVNFVSPSPKCSSVFPRLFVLINPKVTLRSFSPLRTGRFSIVFLVSMDTMALDFSRYFNLGFLTIRSWRLSVYDSAVLQISFVAQFRHLLCCLRLQLK